MTTSMILPVSHEAAVLSKPKIWPKRQAIGAGILVALLAGVGIGSGQDGRSRGLVLTPAGRVMAGQILAARRRLLLEMLADLPLDERACFARVAERLLAQLPASRADAWRICRTCEHDVCRGPACPVGSAVSAQGA
jgi:hypothetical protein